MELYSVDVKFRNYEPNTWFEFSEVLSGEKAVTIFEMLKSNNQILEIRLNRWVKSEKPVETYSFL